MEPTITRCSPVTLEVRTAIVAPLLEHNARFGLLHGGEEMAFALRDGMGEIAGGVLGSEKEGWLYIASLSVREDLRRRGLGRALMARAEAWAREHHAIGIWLDTFSFQAPEFYPKLGFREFGRLVDCPPGQSRFFFEKRLA